MTKNIHADEYRSQIVQKKNVLHRQIATCRAIDLSVHSFFTMGLRTCRRNRVNTAQSPRKAEIRPTVKLRINLARISLGAHAGSLPDGKAELVKNRPFAKAAAQIFK